MSIEGTGAQALDYLTCRYGESRLLFRGPRRKLEKPYLAFLGGNETYGKFVPQPFTNIVEQALGRSCVNLGSLNAGLDSFVNDSDILRIGSRADLTVMQILGAQNLSNRFFRVHSRRNDRFLGPSAMLSAIYREVDFTEFSFNNHMLQRLQMLSPDRFETVRDELRLAWVGRMRTLLSAIDSVTVLLWLRFEEEADGDPHLGPAPLLVTKAMIDELRDLVQGVIEVPVSSAGTCDDLEGMVYGPMDTPIAERFPGPRTHDLIADRLIEALRPAI